MDADRVEAEITRGVQVAAVLVIVLLATLYLASIGPYWNISPDSTTYVGNARALAAEPLRWQPGSEPPVTSIVYSLVLLFRPDGYLWLNTLTQLLILASLGFAFVLIRRRGGPTQAILAVLLTLASAPFYHSSTQLLSEPSYLFFSTAALLLLEPRASAAQPINRQAGSDRTSLRYWVAGALVAVTALTRTIGLTLPVAILIVELRALIGRKGKANGVLIGLALVAVAAVVWWEVRTPGRSYIGGWFRMFVVGDPWSPGPSGGSPSSETFVDHVRDNLRFLPAVGGIFLNWWSPSSEGLGLLLRWAGTAIFAVGLVLALRREISVLAVYVLLYAGVVAAHMLGGGGGEYRFLLPVLPFLFHYALDGARRMATRIARPAAGRRTVAFLSAIAGLYVIWFVSIGLYTAVGGVRQTRTSPFGSYPIKRAQNYDAQRIALWVRDHSAPEDRYASVQRDMYDVLTERRGADLVPGRTTPAAEFMAWLDAERIRYLFVDHTMAGVRDSLLAIITTHPQRFSPVLELPRASLYQVRPAE